MPLEMAILFAVDPKRGLLERASMGLSGSPTPPLPRTSKVKITFFSLGGIKCLVKGAYVDDLKAEHFRQPVQGTPRLLSTRKAASFIACSPFMAVQRHQGGRSHRRCHHLQRADELVHDADNGIL